MSYILEAERRFTPSAHNISKDSKKNINCHGFLGSTILCRFANVMRGKVFWNAYWCVCLTINVIPFQSFSGQIHSIHFPEDRRDTAQVRHQSALQFVALHFHV